MNYITYLCSIIIKIMAKIIKAKRLLTNKELDYYNTLTPVKQKKYLETLFGELFQEIEYDRKNRD